MVRYAAAGSIFVYQRWVSPHKGFCCAYRVLTGGRSCSEYARQTVLDRGILTLTKALPRQFSRCRRAHATLLAMTVASEEAGEQQDGRKRGAAKGSDSGWLDGVCLGAECLALPCDW